MGNTCAKNAVASAAAAEDITGKGPVLNDHVPPPKAAPPPVEEEAVNSPNSVDSGADHDDPGILKQRSRRRLSIASALPVDEDKFSTETRGSVITAERSLQQYLTNNETAALGPRLSISGASAVTLQNSFESKIETVAGGATVDLEHLGIGHACRKGLKPESPNQDDFFIYVLENVHMYGVFDGHGPYGDDVSNFVQGRLGRYVWEHEKFYTDVEATIKECFARVQKEIEDAALRGQFDSNLSGCTGTLVIYDKTNNRVISGHVGDSRAILCIGPKDPEDDEGNNSSAGWTVKDLTEDHKPTLPQEYDRIVNSGGQVKRLVGDIPHRVFLRGKQIPGLAMSRAFGDLVAVQAGVISTPEVSQVELNPEEQALLIVCSDGVWEFISSSQAFEIVRQYGRKQVKLAAENLAREAWNRWRHSEEDVVDDITVEVAYLS